MIKLSIVIITLNEEKNIGRCLESIKSVADEIIIVDSFSTDKTKDICLSYNVRFVEQKFLGYVEQKNFALSLATHDHILSLDADEAPSKELLAGIVEAKKNWAFDGYRFNRLTNYCGHWVRHCGWYPDTKLRLVKKAKAKWVGTNPHDVLVLDDNSNIGFLEGDLLHYSYYSISEHISQLNKFAKIEANSLFLSGKRGSVIKLITRPPFQFIKDYFLRKGFLDGTTGFIVCFINATYVLVKYATMIELEKNCLIKHV